MYRVAFEENQAEPFASPVEGEQAHIKLVERVREIEAAISTVDTPPAGAIESLAQLRDDIAVYEARLVASGAHMPEGNRRDLSQSVLDFWALRQSDLAALAARYSPNEQTMVRQELPAAKLLAPYDEATAVAAAAKAEECYVALPDHSARDAARGAFLSLLQRNAPLSPPEIAALEPFAEAGVLSRLPTDVLEPGYDLGHEALPQAWQRLAEWQLQAAKVLSDLERVRSSAQAWTETKSLSELPQGPAVDVVAKLAEHDDSLKEYAAAAYRRRTRARAIAWAAGVIFAVALIGVSTLTVLLTSRRPSPPGTSIAAEFQATQNEASEEVIVSDQPQSGKSDTAQGSTGWIWLGSTALPQVTLENGTLAGPAGFKGGMKVRTRANLKVRQRGPEDNGENIAGDRIGQVSSDVIVELKKTTSVTVDGVEQYWAEVRVIPVVYVQRFRAADLRMAELRKALADRGFPALYEQKLDRIVQVDPGLPFDVRYYYEQDKQAASEVAGILLRWLGNERVPVDRTLFPLVDTPIAERVKTGTIEVWLYQR